MPSRDYERHVVSTQAPVTTKLGDEYYNPTTNILYKFLANNGTTPSWQQVLLYGQAAGASVTGGGTTFTGGLVANATTITNYFTVFSSTSVTTRGVQEISGNADGSFLAPNNSGVMLHITGQSGQPSRLYIDGQGTGNYAAVIGRKSRGTTALPTQVFANDIVFRMGSTPYTDAAFPAISTTRVDFVADELQTVTAQGSRIEAWITQIGTTSSAIAKQLSIATTGTVIYNTATITQQLGIGLVPTYPLHVNIAATGVTVARFAGGSNVVDIYAGSGGTSYIGDGGARNAFGFNSSGNWLDIWTNNTEKVRVDTNGNILIGGSFTSPSGSSGIVIAGTATSVSTTTGALQVAGGVGIGGNLVLGAGLYAGGVTGTNGQFLVSTGAGVQWASLSSTFNGGTITNPLIVNNNTSATSTNTGALQVAGGVGVGGTLWAGNIRTTSTQIALGKNAGVYGTFGDDAVAIGNSAGGAGGAGNQGSRSVAVGFNTGAGDSSVAIGEAASGNSPGGLAVAIGSNAAYQDQGNHSVSIGNDAGRYAIGVSSVAIGDGAAHGTMGSSQGNYSVAIGYQAGYDGQGIEAISIGNLAGGNPSWPPADYSIAIGSKAGYGHTGQYSVAIGTGAGEGSIYDSAIAIGWKANGGSISNNGGSVSIGSYAGYLFQGANAVAIGANAGEGYQGAGAVAIGSAAGGQGQDVNAIAIGNNAAYDGGYGYLQPANSIIISAAGTNFTAWNTGTFILPIRGDASTSATTWALYYNPATAEITTSTAATGGGALTVQYNGSSLGTATTLNFATGTTATLVGSVLTIQATATGGTTFNGGTITSPLIINNNAASTSTTTGALQVAGGVGIGGTLYVGNLRADATTSATTYGVHYNPVSKELTTSTAASGGGGTALGAVITSAMGWNLP